MGKPILQISSENVRQTLSMEELIPLMEKAMIRYSQGEEGGIVQPVRLTVPVKEQDGFLFSMPGYSAQDKALATKMVTLFPNNTDVPTHHATIILFNPDNGSVLCLMDGEVITEMRTAAVSAVATKYLAPKSSKKLCILGSGHQARSHLVALRLVRDFETISVWSPRKESREAFAQDFGIQACESAEEAVRDADVVVTATLAKIPILLKRFVKPGAHINAVGAPRRDQQELEASLVRESRVIVDSRAGASSEAGDIILSGAVDSIEAELGEVALLCQQKGISCDREGDYTSKTTIFKNLGMAVQDVVSAKFVYDKICG